MTTLHQSKKNFAIIVVNKVLAKLVVNKPSCAISLSYLLIKTTPRTFKWNHEYEWIITHAKLKYTARTQELVIIYSITFWWWNTIVYTYGRNARNRIHHFIFTPLSMSNCWQEINCGLLHKRHYRWPSVNVNKRYRFRKIIKIVVKM